MTSPRVVVLWRVKRAEAERCTAREAEGRVWLQVESERKRNAGGSMDWFSEVDPGWQGIGAGLFRFSDPRKEFIGELNWIGLG